MPLLERDFAPGEIISAPSLIEIYSWVSVYSKTAPCKNIIPGKHKNVNLGDLQNS